ncbi:MAG TPA: hypothetical protein VEB21_16785 [Terriglobales bacterium]|nr:hypothetical protein [Terriglobales bacterium]
MKQWMVVLLGSLWLVAAVQAQPVRNEVEVRDADGKLYAVAVFCNDCKNGPQPGKCDPGAAEGWLGDKPCGSCLMRAAGPAVIKYPYDLHFTGKLVDKDGKPVANRFVKMLLPNGWGVRSKTSEAGTFRLMLGATDERKGQKPILTELGQRTDSTGKEDEHFAIYLLPPSFSPCTGSEPDKPTKAPLLRRKNNES